jgi:hypothetical protein
MRRHTESELLTHIYDGQFWKDFQKYKGADLMLPEITD